MELSRRKKWITHHHRMSAIWFQAAILRLFLFVWFHFSKADLLRYFLFWLLLNLKHACKIISSKLWRLCSVQVCRPTYVSILQIQSSVAFCSLAVANWSQTSFIPKDIHNYFIIFGPLQPPYKFCLGLYLFHSINKCGEEHKSTHSISDFAIAWCLHLNY